MRPIVEPALAFFSVLYIMDNMLGENINKKNSVMDHPQNSQKDMNNLPTNYQGPVMEKLSYTKTNKLIAALYMVTDIMDRDEPVRNKLRNLGAGTISDIISLNSFAGKAEVNFVSLEAKIEEVMSFLEVASSVSLISEMNHSILKKEFRILQESIYEFKSLVALKEDKSPAWLADFLEEENRENSFPEVSVGREKRTPLFQTFAPIKKEDNGSRIHPNGHRQPTRIGLQKGSTLLQALNKVGDTKSVSNKSISHGHAPSEAGGFHSGFDILKKQRREEIVKFLKDRGVATIKDIKDSAGGVLISCGEKTLQRELFSMVGDGVLERSGEKRWSKYSIKS